MTYARRTEVPVFKSRMELEQLLTKQGADRRAVAEEPGKAVVFFVIGKLQIRFTMRLASNADVPPKAARSANAANAWLEQRHREQWRTLVLVLRAKFAALEGGVETFEQAFLAHIVVPREGGGTTTVGELALPMVSETYKSGKAFAGFLLGPGGPA